VVGTLVFFGFFAWVFIVPSLSLWVLTLRVPKPDAALLAGYAAYSATSWDHGVGSPAHIHGRVVAVNLTDGKVDEPIYYLLPDDLRATKPEDVETIAWIACSKRKYGAYTSGGTAWREYCTVKVIDRELGGVVGGEKEFLGEKPPVTKNEPGDASGGGPSRQVVVDYLAALPKPD
jgi:hypothetical protein